MGQGLNEHRVFSQAAQTVITAERLLQGLNQMDFIQGEYGDMSVVLTHQVPVLLVDEQPTGSQSLTALPIRNQHHPPAPGNSLNQPPERQ